MPTEKWKVEVERQENMLIFVSCKKVCNLKSIMKTNKIFRITATLLVINRAVKIFVFLVLSFFPISSFAQSDDLRVMNEFNANLIQENDAKNPCITEMEYAIIEKRCADNIKGLNLTKNLQKQILTTSLQWPLQTAGGFTDCSYYVISAYVDENPTAGAFQDWNCGTHAYDGHRGTDIAIWPFSFNKVDSSTVEVITAAAGTIIDKHDGEFDRNCVGVGSGLLANYVIIQHADGSRALYWHMKQNSITPKAIGQAVVTGEYLGVVASSGSSSGPHLHFEVWAGNTASTMVDPYFGTCNLLNASSWWSSQKPVSEPSVLKASVHITDFYPKVCPSSDTTNEATSYVLPFTGPGMSTNFAKFYIFLRDVTAGSIANLSVLNPDGSTYSSWNYTFPGTYMLTYWGWSKHLPSMAGVCTFRVIYNGDTCSQNFTISYSTGIPESNDLLETMIYPNPSNGQFIVSLPSCDAEIIVSDLLGKQLLKTKTIQKETNLIMRNSGIYFVRVSTPMGTITRKLIVNR